MQHTPAKHHPARLDPIRTRMAAIIDHWTAGQEGCPTPVPGLQFFRREGRTEPCPCLVEPSVVLVLQGAKQLLIGGEAYAYDPDRFLITSLDLPASSQVLDASPSHPCLGLSLRLDLRIMAELIAQIGLPPAKGSTQPGSASLGNLTPPLLDSLLRLLELLEEPASIPVLAPLIEREVHFRLLMSDQATRLWQIASAGTQSHRIARAIDWLKTHYVQTLRIEELAAHAQMSSSSLHHHFRQLTAMSPLQYQKWLRLNEARRLMLNESMDAASAAFQVGYESPSHFSREYSRLFGMPPRRDIEGLRHRNAES